MLCVTGRRPALTNQADQGPQGGAGPALQVGGEIGVKYWPGPAGDDQVLSVLISTLCFRRGARHEDQPRQTWDQLGSQLSSVSVSLPGSP